jgi:hypothetical protein
VKRLRRWLGLVVLVGILAGAASAHALIVEAEDFVAYHDEGGVGIYRKSCSAASGGLSVEGFDTVGDWIEVQLTVAANGSFTDTLRSAGLLDSASVITSTVFGCGPSGEDLVSDFSTLGLGIY